MLGSFRSEASERRVDAVVDPHDFCRPMLEKKDDASSTTAMHSLSQRSIRYVVAYCYDCGDGDSDDDGDNDGGVDDVDFDGGDDDDDWCRGHALVAAMQSLFSVVALAVAMHSLVLRVRTENSWRFL